MFRLVQLPVDDTLLGPPELAPEVRRPADRAARGLSRFGNG
ncbi:hypothetical protein [Nocardiopsis suaedae]|uniref:Uncharacterized protein n=1 Tax=Nocardiopsis suaedae TaxID=3018444 RepID=A0ABT4TJ79_9ACTN|nr:hypothetical protein [Nocardiopsis suaedae]MDA2804759.1 hypothetical protein [Nocardiopsis suaedae]